jgi:PhnB protein
MKTSLVQPYLFFGGRCQEAIDFYCAALGGKVEMLMRFKDSPDQPPAGTVPPDWGDGVMHASVLFGETRLMASDGCVESKGFEGFSLSLNPPDEAEARRAFAALSEGGKVTMPLEKTFWSPCFGMLTDRFGVSWLVNVD